MNKIRFGRRVIGGIVIALTVLTISCTPAAGTEPPAEEPTAEPPTVEVPTSETVTMFVGPETADCVGVGPMTCLMVRYDENDEWTMFYDKIAGFEHETGFDYELRVERTEVENPPADASSLRYELLDIVSKTAAASDAALPDGLIGSEWDLIEMAGAAPLEGTSITISFDQDQFNGSAGCNSYFGGFTLDGSELSVGPMGNTEMWCEGAMDQESAYLALLSTAETLTLESGALIIHSAGGDLIFSTPTDQTLEQVTWMLGGIAAGDAVVSTSIDQEITAEFVDGRLTGYAGCNNYFADYEIDGGKLLLGPAGSTRMACDEARNAREFEYLTGLASVVSFEICRETMILMDIDGKMLMTFRMQASEDQSGDQSDDLIGIEWQWQAYQDTAGINDITVDKPANYTLTLLDDGSYQLLADCNRGSGSLDLEGSSISFGPGPMTMAACDPDSLDTLFLQRLGDVVTYVLEEGKLYLNLKMDAGNMVFQAAQPEEVVEQSYTFEDGADGWEHGFADLPADADESFYQLSGGREAMPGDLNGFGYRLRGDNHSDDLFMFVKARVAGLTPGARYDVSFEIDLATAVPDGLVGIGGSPGESVYLKAGASTAEPAIAEDDSGFLRLTVDKGQQSKGGTEMVVLGHIAYPSEQSTGSEWQIKPFFGDAGPIQVTAREDGALWLIVGTDSGFEGVTDIYLGAITVTLTPSA